VTTTCSCGGGAEATRDARGAARRPHEAATANYQAVPRRAAPRLDDRVLRRAAARRARPRCTRRCTRAASRRTTRAALPALTLPSPGPALVAQQVAEVLTEEAREAVSVSDLVAQLQALQAQVAAANERVQDMVRALRRRIPPSRARLHAPTSVGLSVAAPHAPPRPVPRRSRSRA
jgi:hypothetical protein